MIFLCSQTDLGLSNQVPGRRRADASVAVSVTYVPELAVVRRSVAAYSRL